MRFFCERCRQAFDSEEDHPRCARCLRKSSVIDRRAAPAEPRPKRPFLPRFAAAFGFGALLFFALSLRGSLLGVPLESTGLRLYAIVLGGLLLALVVTLVPMRGMFSGFGPHDEH